MSAVRNTDEIIASLRQLAQLKNDGVINETEFERLKSELLSGGNAPVSEDLKEYADDLFRLDETAEPKNEKPDLDGIDFNIDHNDVISFEKKSSSNGISDIRRYFSRMKKAYIARDCAIMDAEAISSLAVLPVFIIGIAAAFFFYYLLIIYGEAELGTKELIIFLLICGGVFPACVIIPNTVKAAGKSRTAQEADEALRKYYIKSGYTHIPYEYTNPHILSRLEEIIEDGKADSIDYAIKLLSAAISDDEVLAEEKRLADLSDSDEAAERAAALYVVGKGLINKI